MATGDLNGRTIALCVSGGIAAYKAVVVARLLVQRGATVQPVMTASGQRFVGKVTLGGVCGRGVLDDMWDPRFAGESHVVIAQESDLVLIVPCTADLLARLAQGRADDLVAALALVAKSPVLVAPAMHPRMWAHPATARNVGRIRGDGRVHFVGPVYGPVASGEVGVGRMAEPDEIVAAAVGLLGSTGPRAAAAPAHRDLSGRHVVVTAGPTVEDFDPVRFLGNRSTGRMGFAVAEAAAARGARVTLVCGPVALATPNGVERVDVRSALEMQAALDDVLGPRLEGADALVMAAAVADYRPVVPALRKSKKLRASGFTEPGAASASLAGETITIELARNPDILATIGARRARAGSTTPTLVGFAVETEELVEYARTKRLEKQVDVMVANLAMHGFGGESNEVVIVSGSGERAVRASKREIADVILDEVAAAHGRR